MDEEEPIEDVIKFLIEHCNPEYENDIKRLKKAWNKRGLYPLFDIDMSSPPMWGDDFLRYWKQAKLKARVIGKANWAEF